MIDYKLAKELEDAGLKLPFDKYRKQWRVNWEVKKTGRVEEIILVRGENYETKGDCEEGACGSYLINIPTLSELIEECGVPIRLWGHKDSWGVDTLDGTKAEGETPKIAVANLYLALNKK